MPVAIELPDGSIIEFPDSMTPQERDGAVGLHLGVTKPDGSITQGRSMLTPEADPSESGVISQLGERGKELILDIPGRTATRGFEQLKRGELLPGVGNLALSPFQTLGGVSRFLFGDPATTVARGLGAGPEVQELVGTTAELVGGGGVTALGLKVPGITARIVSEAIGLGKPLSGLPQVPKGVPKAPKGKSLDALVGAKNADQLPEVKQILESTANVPLPKYAGNINLERLDMPGAFKQLMVTTAEQNKGLIDEARRGVITLEQTKGLADDFGLTVEQLMKTQKGAAMNAEGVTAARQILASSVRDVFDLTKRALDTRTPDAMADVWAAMNKNLIIQSKVSGVVAESARATGSLRAIIGAGPARDRAIRGVVESLGGADELSVEVLERLARLDPTDIRGTNMFLRDIAKAKTTDKIFEAWMNGLLSSPATHVVNSVSNSLIALSRLPERVLAAGIDATRAMVTGGARERFLGEVAGDAFGMTRGVTEGVRKGIRSFIDEIPTQGIDKLEVPSRARQAIKGAFGKAVRTPGRLLIAEDEFFKAINYTGEMHVQAYRQAAKEGLKGGSRSKRIAEILQNPSEEMVEKSLGEALYRTFQQPLGPAGSSLLKLRNQIPGARFVVPFLRTPINIAKYGLERVPLNPINYIRMGKAIRAGELSKGELADMAAKMTSGMIMGGAVASLASQGYITGGGPNDPQERKEQRDLGWKPYSVRLFGRYFSYARLEPLSILLGTTADAVELGDEIEWEDAVGKIGWSIARNLTSKIYLAGLSDLLNAVSDPQRYGQNWVQRFAGSAVPAGVASVARGLDPTRRAPQSVGQAIQARIPGLSFNVPPLRDIWGRPVISTETAAERVLSPIRRSRIRRDKATEELIRLDIPIGSPRRELRKWGIVLDDADYESYVERTGQFTHAAVIKVVNAPGYNAMSDKDKASGLRMAMDPVKRKARLAVEMRKIIKTPKDVTEGMRDVQSSIEEKIEQATKRLQRITGE
jgi:hypothetical protein